MAERTLSQELQKIQDGGGIDPLILDGLPELARGLEDRIGKLTFDLDGARKVFGWIADDPTGAQHNAKDWIRDDEILRAMEAKRLESTTTKETTR